MKINGKEVRSLSPESLAFHQKDLREVIQLQQEMAKNGHNTPKLAQYEAELQAVNAEIARRIDGGIRQRPKNERVIVNTLAELAGSFNAAIQWINEHKGPQEAPAFLVDADLVYQRAEYIIQGNDLRDENKELPPVE